MCGTGSALRVQLWSEESGWRPPGWYSSVPSGAAHVSWCIPSCGACTLLLSPWPSITVIFPICIISPIALSCDYHSCWRIRGSPLKAFALRTFSFVNPRSWSSKRGVVWKPCLVDPVVDLYYILVCKRLYIWCPNLNGSTYCYQRHVKILFGCISFIVFQSFWTVLVCVTLQRTFYSDKFDWEVSLMTTENQIAMPHAQKAGAQLWGCDWELEQIGCPHARWTRSTHNCRAYCLRPAWEDTLSHVECHTPPTGASYFYSEKWHHYQCLSMVLSV